MARLERKYRPDLALVHPDHHADAVNLTHYLALRQADVRSLQRNLGARGVSSMARCEGHVLATVETVRAELDASTARPLPPELGFQASRAALDRNTDALFGPRPQGRVPRIMVTLPSEAASDYALVRRFVSSGMDVARINGAHDDPDAWEQMARNVRKASTELDRHCRVCVDLPGPRLRTGPLVEGPRLVRLRPERDLRGVAVAPALAVLTGGEASHGGTPPALPVDAAWLERRKLGDTLHLVDTRGARRRLAVVAEKVGELTLEVWDTTYIETGAELRCARDVTRIGRVPPVPQYHLLGVGDRIGLTRNLEPADPWTHGQQGMARIGCSVSAAFEAAQPGHRVVLDDGKLSGVVEQASPDEIVVRIVSASPRGSKLRAEKGINLPETDLPVPAVTEADLPLLQVAAAHADMVALSSIRHERDVDALQDFLSQVGAVGLGRVLRVETEAAFSRLPEILMHAMRSQLVGVMVAPGDPAVEVGDERLAEMQEEILWVCESAHLPVIWGTGVLDQLARTGQPSRAELTNAAMAQRAECVMSGQGPYVDTAMIVLDSILRRTSGHPRQKAVLVGPLHGWDAAGGASEGPDRPRVVGAR